ncbi:MAG TPA: translational GTPase TypA [Bdellovibrionota bacterium]|nr:translational GTPase TypA [Bdellovibrionota bacterium]
MSLNIRNVCIIAHVDHGKTTLVDYLLRQAGTFKQHQALTERVMDSMDLERERGITILAKNASVYVEDTKINIVDTPGHADFGGEVERILGMVDGALLLVDAAEGPLPQTRFVLQKALEKGLKIILVINKVDRPECRENRRIQEVVNQTFDLFVELGASETQVEFSIVYACAREGWCTVNDKEVPALLSGEKKGTLKPLFDLILSEVPPPRISDAPGFQMLVSNLAYSDYVGRLAVGRVTRGSVKKNDRIFHRGVDEEDEPTAVSFTVTQVLTFGGLKQIEVAELTEGDLGLVAGCEEAEIGDTFAGNDNVPALPRIAVEKPTIGMIFSVSTSPFSGQDGEAIQSRKLRERLLREVRQNVALRFEELDSPDQFRMLGRGELQLSILIEQMRREGFEFMVGKPIVLMHKGKTGGVEEPIERLVLDLPETYVGEVTQMFQTRKGIMTRFEPMASGLESAVRRIRLEFTIPTRGLLGMRSRFLTGTRGEGLMSSEFLRYEPHKGEVPHRTNGALVSDREGETVEYGLLGLEDRGMLFVRPGIKVYEGMVVGEHNKENDLNVNPCREKKLTNIRAAHAEVLVTLSGIRSMSLEESVEWIDEDEWIEVTPKSIRLRKKVLPKNLRSVVRS